MTEIARASLLSAEIATRITAASLLAAGGGLSAGVDQSVAALETVVLTASGVAEATWSQVSGPAVTITPTGALTASLVAPAAQTSSVIVARATSGASTDDVTVMVAPHGEWWTDGAAWRPLMILPA